MSYDLPTISQTLPMHLKPIVSSVTTKLRLQNRSKFLNMTKNCQDIVRWLRPRATSHDLPPMVRDHSKITHVSTSLVMRLITRWINWNIFLICFNNTAGIEYIFVGFIYFLPYQLFRPTFYYISCIFWIFFQGITSIISETDNVLSVSDNICIHGYKISPFWMNLGEKIYPVSRNFDLKYTPFDQREDLFVHVQWVWTQRTWI